MLRGISRAYRQPLPSRLFPPFSLGDAFWVLSGSY